MSNRRIRKTGMVVEPPFASGELPLHEAAEFRLGEEGAGFPAAEEVGELCPVEGIEGEEVRLPEEGEAALVGRERLTPRTDVAGRELHCGGAVSCGFGRARPNFINNIYLHCLKDEFRKNILFF